ncbi:MAG TPA: COX15/CtaA family protein, partial [Pirellulales bacterium]|nr:COX15/CtaA family protein [Pirellulales bacterium]
MVEVKQSESRLPHAIAVVLVCATFPLIFVGGLVTTYEAGMAVPDWPTTYGYNLFLYPKWASGPWDLFVEHGHRLLGATVGLITIAALVAVWMRDARRWLKVYSVLMLVAVCAQGVLGGLRVRLDERVVAKVHACTAPLFFAMTVALAAFTSRRWRSATPAQWHEHATKLKVLSLATASVAWLQIVMGARLRHVSIEQPPHEFGDAVFWH